MGIRWRRRGGHPWILATGAVAALAGGGRGGSTRSGTEVDRDRERRGSGRKCFRAARRDLASLPRGLLWRPRRRSLPRPPQSVGIKGCGREREREREIAGESSFIERTICRVFECTETIHIFLPPKVYIILRFPIFKLSTLQQKKRQTGKSTLINNNYYPAGITRHLLISKRVTQLTAVILRSLQAF